MALNVFQWDEDFNTGNESVDTQHFALVEMINDLLELSINSDDIDLETLKTISDNLLNYVREHFTSEEALMKKHAIDQRHIKEQIKLHRDFENEVIKQFKDLSKLLDSDKITEAAEYLIRWLAYHILNTDKSMVRQINYIVNDGLSPEEAYVIEEKITEASTEPLLKALRVLYLLVSKKNVEIKKKNTELEATVKKRTAELLETNMKLNEMIFHDTLTELPNRRFIMEEIQKLIFNWSRYKVPFSILFVDVDKFKVVNDTYGHEKGDQVLKWIAHFLESHIRVTDIACRLGGDEFVIICSHTTKEGAISLGQKLNETCEKECKRELEYWHSSLSIGVAMIDETIASPSDMLKLADSAMYISKTNGGGSTSFIEK